jgi:hypothetical protein
MARATYAKRQPTHPGRIDFKPKDFDDLAEDQGCRVRITPTVVCPRRTTDTTEDVGHDLNCPLCNGRQIVDLPTFSYETWAVIMGIKLDKNFAQQSMFDVKDATITVKANERLSYWFKIEVIDFASFFNEIVKRNKANVNVDKLRYPVTEPYDGHYYSLIDGDGHFYTKETDYTVSGNNITWKTSHRPHPDRPYSFLYPVLPTFRVMELLHANRYYYTSYKQPVKTPVQLPQQAHIRWDYMAGRSIDVQRPS